MDASESPFSSAPPSRAHQAEAILADLFAGAGWSVHRDADRDYPLRPDMVIRKGGMSYAVELKAAPDGRSDRLLPLWSQAYLQAARAAGGGDAPLAVIAAPKIAPRAAKSILKFAADYAPNAAVGVIDLAGLRVFRGPQLEGLDSDIAELPSPSRSVPAEQANLFSDLNQWMLKVLLAPELPEGVLSAPRGHYRNAAEIARAASVSPMSAFRFVQQLQREGYLDEPRQYLNLVRREDLFRRWQASAERRVREISVRFLLPGDPQRELRRILHGGGRACLGLFAAAEALHYGFVSGVPAHVYVERFDQPGVAWSGNIVSAERHEMPDLILREASAPESVFRGLVSANDVPVCDILQVWLDVSAHPSRGQEQADLIRRRVLDPLIRAA